MKDKPTEKQLECIYGFIRWYTPLGVDKKAVDWAEQNRTKAEATKEVRRLWSMYTDRKLTNDNWKNSTFWVGFEE